jgi:hypothetical protein
MTPLRKEHRGLTKAEDTAQAEPLSEVEAGADRHTRAPEVAEPATALTHRKCVTHRGDGRRFLRWGSRQDRPLDHFSLQFLRGDE